MAPKNTTPAPRTVQDDPKYATLAARLAALHSEEAEAQREMNETWEAMAQLKDGSSHHSPLDRQAAALIAGEAPADSHTAARSTLAARHDAAQQRIHVLKRACEMVRQQMDAARGEASALIGREAAPAHKALLREIVLAAVRYQGALAAEQRFRDDLERRGFSATAALRSLDVMPPDFGRPDAVGQGTLWYVLRSAVEAGVITNDEFAEIRAPYQAQHERAA